ncbi:hypothetical protein MKW92_020990 [Papaver armeniacum]|nr:hypothetical protein MKW92_020990 [Papaver armeniacum]
MASSSEDQLKLKLQDLQKQIGKRQMFEEAVSNIKSLMIENYPSASPSLRKLIYTVVCRVATVLQTRYTASVFWFAGKELFEQAERLVTESSERQHLKSCIARAREHLHEKEKQPVVSKSNRGPSRYLFEGHLTVDTEPPRPQCLVAQDLLNVLAAGAGISQAARESFNTTEAASSLMADLATNLTTEAAAIEASLQDKHNSCPDCRHELPTDNQNYERKKARDKEREKEDEEERKGAANAVRGGEYMYV